MAAETAFRNPYTLSALARVGARLADLPPERQWMKPYFRAGLATGIVGVAVLFGYLVEAVGVGSPNLWLEDGLAAAALLAFGCSVGLFLALSARAKKMASPKPSDRLP